MGSEWRLTTVGEFCPFSYGRGLPKHKRNPQGSVPCLGSNGIVGYHDTPLTQEPTVVIGRKGTVGAVHYSPIPCWPIDTTFYVTSSDSSLLRFKYYLLKSLGLERMNADSAVPGLNREAAHALEIRVPEETEQRAIARVLGALDDKIELNRRMSETLEAMARAIFKAWFVDFEPVRAKMEGRWRKGESLPGLPAHLWDLFPDRLVESEIGEIPEGWRVGKLRSIAEQVRDQVKPFDLPHDLFRHFSIPAFDEGQWPRDELGVNIKSAKFRVPEGVVLLSKLNPDIERVWLADVQEDDRAICSTEFIVLRPRKPIGRAFVYCLARSPLFRQRVKTLATGTSKSHQRAQATSILDLPAPHPPVTLGEAFEQVAGPLLERSLAGHRQSRTLAAIGDALLPKLLRGEIRVGEAEQLAQAEGL